MKTLQFKCGGVVVLTKQQLLQFFKFVISVCLLSSPCHGAIYVVSDLTNDTVLKITDMPARYVPERYTFYGMTGYLVYADPPTACAPVKPPPPYNTSIGYPISWILLAKRSPDCHFQTKIENAQNMGYSAIIIHNVGSNETEIMGVEDPGKLMIYATFIGEYDGLLLKNFTYQKGYTIRIRDDFSVNGYFLPFAVVVGICIIVMLLFMLWQQVVRWYRERRRSRRRKLPASELKKLPVHKWTKGDPYETCAVCLDDFVEQEKIRILPCYHGYHIQCIDHWLTKGRRVCPICKRKVIVADEQISDSDTETEDEHAPLIPAPSASQNPPSGASTFIQNQINVRVIGIGSRRLLARNRQNAANDSDASSISSGVGVADDHDGCITQSTASTRPSTSAASLARANPSHHSVFAEVHQSSEMIKRIMEAKTQNRSDNSTHVAETGESKKPETTGLENGSFCEERNLMDLGTESSSQMFGTTSGPCASQQLVVVIESGSNDNTRIANENGEEV